MEICEDLIYLCGFPGWAQQDPLALPKLALVLPLFSAAEAPQDHLVVSVMHGIPYGYVAEQMAVFPVYVICQAPHPLP